MKAKALADSHPDEQACSCIRKVLKSRRNNSAARGSPDVQISCSATRVAYGWYEDYGPLLYMNLQLPSASSSSVCVCERAATRSDSSNSVCFSREVTSTHYRVACSRASIVSPLQCILAMPADTVPQ